MSTQFQKQFEIVMEKLLTSRLGRILFIPYIKLLFHFHYLWENLHKYVGTSNMNTWALGIALILSRLHLGGFLILICLLILRLEMSFRRFAKYYQHDMTRLTRDFPYWYQDKRHMRKATQAIAEALEDPKVQAVAIAVTGALAWKTLDVWDTYKAADIADKDREAAAIQADKDREAATIQADKDREAENARHRESLDVEIKQRELDRETENARHRESLDTEIKQRELDRESAERIASQQ